MNAIHELWKRDPVTRTLRPRGTHQEFVYHDCDDLQSPSGVSCQDGQFLYAIAQLIQPNFVLELGTNIGTSTQFIALALEHNKKGHLVSIEHDETVANRAKKKLEDVKLKADILRMSCEAFQPCEKIDLLFLDTELKDRYNQFVQFYDYLADDAYIAIHDLNNIEFQQFGPMPVFLRDKIAGKELTYVEFATPMGMTLFHRRKPC